MIFNFEELKTDTLKDIKGVIHVGGHRGQEYDEYKKLEVPILFFEPLPMNYQYLSEKTKEDLNTLAFQCALGNENKKVVMNVETANQGQSSSILKPKKHLEQYPHITFDFTVEVDMFRLDDIAVDTLLYNFMNVDVQGYELEVFKGAAETLKTVDYIISEVNCDEVYEGCPHVSEIDAFLSEYGFERIKTDWAGVTWGDALYVKK
jgi:FkbM family methyltransferase